MLKHGLTKTVPWYYKTGAALEVLGGSSNSQHAMIHMQSTMSKGFQQICFHSKSSLLPERQVGLSVPRPIDEEFRNV